MDIRYESFTIGKLAPWRALSGAPAPAPAPLGGAPRRALAPAPLAGPSLPERAPRRALALAFALGGALALPACVPPRSYGESSYKPGFSTFINMPDGTQGQVFTTYLPDGSEGRTTGKVGNYTVNCFAGSCEIEED